MLRLEKTADDTENNREKEEVPDRRGRTGLDPVETPLKRRRTWPEERVSSSSESDPFPASDEEAHTLCM